MRRGISCSKACIKGRYSRSYLLAAKAFPNEMCPTVSPFRYFQPCVPLIVGQTPVVKRVCSRGQIPEDLELSTTQAMQTWAGGQSERQTPTGPSNDAIVLPIYGNQRRYSVPCCEHPPCDSGFCIPRDPASLRRFVRGSRGSRAGGGRYPHSLP